MAPKRAVTEFLLCCLVLLLLCRAVTSGGGSLILLPNSVVYTGRKWSSVVSTKVPKSPSYKKAVCSGTTAAKKEEKFKAFYELEHLESYF